LKTSDEKHVVGRRLLPAAHDIERALGPNVRVEPVAENAAMQNIGAVAAAAAEDVAYRSFRGQIVFDDVGRQIAVGELALVFDRTAKAENTFARVADAAHLRIRLGASNVAVETVTAPNGLVSYWGYVQKDEVLLILTLDTLDPQDVSMTSFRALVTLGADRLENGR